jgi:hypothetical protein
MPGANRDRVQRESSFWTCIKRIGLTREDRVRVNVVVVVNFLVCFVGISATSSQLLQRQLRASQSDPENDKIQQLVLQLGSTDYQNRLRAERELLKLGIQAVEPIRQCIDPVAGVLDLEIQLRGRRVLAEIMKSDFESRVTRFLADDDATEPSTVCSAGTNRCDRRL